MDLQTAKNLISGAKVCMLVGGKPIGGDLDSDAALMLLGAKPKRRPRPYKDPQKAELFFSLLNILNGFEMKAVDTDTLLKLDLAVYKGVGEDAGALRKKPLTLFGADCTPPEYVAGSLKRLLAQMDKCASSPEISKYEFCNKLTHFYAELLVLSPFSQSDGIALRAFIAAFAVYKGFDLGYYKVGSRKLKEAEQRALLSDEKALLYECLEKAVTYAKKTVSSVATSTRPAPQVSNAQKNVLADRKSAQKPRRINASQQSDGNSPAARIKPANGKSAPEQPATTEQQPAARTKPANEQPATDGKTQTAATPADDYADVPEETKKRIDKIQSKIEVLNRELDRIINDSRNKR